MNIQSKSQNQAHILAELLDMASNEFGNHGCNDYELPNTEENRALMEAALRWNSEAEWKEYGLNLSKDGKTIYTRDYFLMGYFAHLLHIEAGDK